MPPTSLGSPATAGVEYGLRTLDDGLLQRIFSCLPADEVARTMILSKEWRHKWKLSRCLRVSSEHGYTSASKMNEFINSYLLLSGRNPISVVDISLYPDPDSEESVKFLGQWVQNCIMRDAQILRVHNPVHDYLSFCQEHLSSSHLKVLDLYKLELTDVLSDQGNCRTLDLSNCPLLEVLTLEKCGSDTILIKSPSVRRLTLKSCDFSWTARAQISVPNVTVLTLANCKGKTPTMEKMPSLKTAFIRLQTDLDFCSKNYEHGGCNDCFGCRRYSEGGITELLYATSSATHLELTSWINQFIFRMEMAFCPTFSALKTLVLNEWCVTPSLNALRCLLQHTPALKELKIQFPRQHIGPSKIIEDIVENGAFYNIEEEYISLKQLHVELICPEEEVIAATIFRILGLLRSFQVPPSNINIEMLPPLTEEDKYKTVDDYNEAGAVWPSARFSFELLPATQDIFSTYLQFYLVSSYNVPT